MTTQRPTQWTTARCSLVLLACAAAWSAVQAQDTAPVIPTPSFEQTPACPVVRVAEACTVRVRMDDAERRIALLGVAIPKDEEVRDRLRRFLENVLQGEAVFVQPDRESADDAEGLRPAGLFRAPDGLFVNLEVVRQGYAEVQPESAGEHLELLRYYEQRARQAQKGIWAPRPHAQPVREARVTASQPSHDLGEIIVYVTNSGKKYHRQDCYHVRKSARPISLKEAVAKGYEPCAHCKPPTLKEP